jgi:hypothetical protein
MLLLRRSKWPLSTPHIASGYVLRAPRLTAYFAPLFFVSIEPFRGAFLPTHLSIAMSSTLQTSKESSVKEADNIEKGPDVNSSPTNDDGLQESDDSKYISGQKLYLINFGLIVSIFIVQMESSIISTAVVDITDQLGGYEKSSWLFTAYLLSYCGTFARRYVLVCALTTAKGFK